MSDRPIHDLTNLFSDFPGLGPRQARRVVQFLLSKNQQYRSALASAIETIGSKVGQCTTCFRFNGADGKLCTICADVSREPSLMVVERDVDVEAIESSGAYHGKYFVLGGLIPMTKRKRDKGARVKELIERIKKDGVNEIIFALSATPEGDYTAQELNEKLCTTDSTKKITVLGRGLSVGAEIEYADSETLRNALRNRS